jgi:Spondin-like TSP1 domain
LNERRFDDLTRRIARVQSRRSVLRGLLTGASALVTAKVGSWKTTTEAKLAGLTLGALCVNPYTGSVSAPPDPASSTCPANHYSLPVPDALPFTLSINPYTGAIRHASTPIPGWQTIELPDADAVTFCMNRYTHQLHSSPNGTCSVGYYPAAFAPIDCVVNWTDWTPCSVVCGGGLQTRTGTIVTKPAFGGQACPPLVEIQDCNSQACPPVDCVVEWTDWTPCSVACGGGLQSRTRTVVTEPANGGQECPPLVETQACNTQACFQVCASDTECPDGWDCLNGGCFKRTVDGPPQGGCLPPCGDIASPIDSAINYCVHVPSPSSACTTDANCPAGQFCHESGCLATCLPQS